MCAWHESPNAEPWNSATWCELNEHFTKHIWTKWYWLLILLIWGTNLFPSQDLSASFCWLISFSCFSIALSPYSSVSPLWTSFYLSETILLYLWLCWHPPSSFPLCQYAIHFVSHPVTFSHSLLLSFWFYILGCRSFFHSSSLSLSLPMSIYSYSSLILITLFSSSLVISFLSNLQKGKGLLSWHS